jgi:hypothetical protein
VIQGTPPLLEHGTDFYKNHFCPEQGSRIRLRDNLWEDNEKFNEEDMEDLDRLFTEEENKDVIDQMEKIKSTRHNGMHVEFCQRC